VLDEGDRSGAADRYRVGGCASLIWPHLEG
jgi:hypothetical protein